MPAYFFDVYDGADQMDTDGTELRDIYKAQEEAVRLCGVLIAEEGARFWDRGHWKLVVSDDTRTPLFEIVVSATEHGQFNVDTRPFLDPSR